jgi:hypothetical protein
MPRDFLLDLERDRGIAHGGVGVMHALVRRLGLLEAIDRRLVLFKFHLPYHESDHVLNLADNALGAGTCLEDIEWRRNDEAFLDALGARRIPDPTTAGDFCRRFDVAAIRSLQNAFHDTRLKVWAEQQVATQRRQRPDNVKDAVVKRRPFETRRLQSEEVAAFNDPPTACHQEYRRVVIRKNISKEKGELRLYDAVRYCFYITNDWGSEAEELVFSANDRCDPENLLAQLLSGCRALPAPVDNLESNWAYLVMTAWAWDLKAWWALLLPEGQGGHRESYQADKLWVFGLEFKTFVQTLIRQPCQIVRTGRRRLYRFMSWNPYQPIFFRLVDVLRC